jgi:hypothetical protein
VASEPRAEILSVAKDPAGWRSEEYFSFNTLPAKMKTRAVVDSGHNLASYILIIGGRNPKSTLPEEGRQFAYTLPSRRSRSAGSGRSV